MSWDELRQEAFGEIGVNPTEFYNMEREDYWLLHKGKRVYDMRNIRRAVMTIIAPWLKNMPSPYSVMPLPLDDELKEITRELNKANYERSLKTLKLHSRGGFEYVKDFKTGQIVKQQSTNN
jgi:hypothetical protein